MDEIQVNQTEKIATVVINRPEVKNAVTSKMWDELTDVFTRLGYDDSVRAESLLALVQIFVQVRT